MTTLLGVDIGGSGIKGAPVDVGRGEMAAERHRIATPQPATPGAVAEVVAAVAAQFEWEGDIGCGLPAPIVDGVATAAANIDEAWVGTDAVELIGRATGRRVHVVNDADAAGTAEVLFGAGRGQSGVVLVLTFGSGIGSSLFHNGRLVPNSELGHLEFRGMEAEHYAASRLIEHDGMAMDVWVVRVREYLEHVSMLFSPSLIVFGGGISKRFDEFGDRFDIGVPVVPAELRNDAGIVGAALAAHAKWTSG